MAYNDGMGEAGDAAGSGAQVSEPIRILLKRLPKGRFIPLLFTLPFLLRMGYELFDSSSESTREMISRVFVVDFSIASVLIPLGLVTITLTATMYLLLRDYHRSIPQRIERSGVLEKLAQGPGGLPDLSEYAVFPLSLIPRSKGKRISFKQQVFLIVVNLNWYLHEKPKPFGTLVWLFPLAVLFFPVYFDMSQRAASLSLYTTQQEWQVMLIEVLLNKVIAIASWWYMSYMLGRWYAACTEFRKFIRDRYGIQ